MVHVSQFSTTLCQQIFFNNLLFFTSTHSLLLLQFIFIYFYLDFISSTCLPSLSLVSFQISKSYLWSIITWAPKARLSEKHLRHKKVKKKKKIRGTQSHRHCRDHEEKWKAKQKRDRDTREMHQIVKFVKKLS